MLHKQCILLTIGLTKSSDSSACALDSHARVRWNGQCARGRGGGAGQRHRVERQALLLHKQCILRTIGLTKSSGSFFLSFLSAPLPTPTVPAACLTNLHAATKSAAVLGPLAQ